MKLLDDATIAASPDGCAGAVMDTALRVVRLLKAEIRRSRPGRLSLQQVRTLACVESCPGGPLSRIADLLGLALPSTSHLVDGLVRRGLLARRTAPADRRRIRLALTARGERALERAFDLTRADLAGRLKPLNAAQRASVVEAIRLLRPLLAGPDAPPRR